MEIDDVRCKFMPDVHAPAVGGESGVAEDGFHGGYRGGCVWLQQFRHSQHYSSDGDGHEQHHADDNSAVEFRDNNIGNHHL